MAGCGACHVLGDWDLRGPVHRVLAAELGRLRGELRRQHLAGADGGLKRLEERRDSEGTGGVLWKIYVYVIYVKYVNDIYVYM